MLVNHHILIETKKTHTCAASPNDKPEHSVPDSKQSQGTAEHRTQALVLLWPSFYLNTFGSRCSLDMPADLSK